jgi:hypothetical protein
VLFACVSAAIFAGCAGDAGGGGLGSNGISDAEGASITAGMSVAQVKTKLGKPETITKSESTFSGTTTMLVTYSYSGLGDSLWVFSFTNGQMDASPTCR